MLLTSAGPPIALHRLWPPELPPSAMRVRDPLDARPDIGPRIRIYVAAAHSLAFSGGSVNIRNFGSAAKLREPAHSAASGTTASAVPQMANIGGCQSQDKLFIHVLNLQRAAT
jgi:hypothetical protein